MEEQQNQQDYHYYKACTLIYDNLGTEDKIILNYIADVNHYRHLFEGNGFSIGVTLARLPYSLSYFEHPYWLITKINYIMNMINKVLNEKHKKGK